MTEPLAQTINEKLCIDGILKGYGKRGHGMNGKDADLDRIGQCRVEELVTEWHEGSMRVAIGLNLYASICAPSCENIEFSKLSDGLSEDSKKFFMEYHGVDVDSVDWDDVEKKSTRLAMRLVVDHFRDQAELIMVESGFAFFQFMWDGESAWDGSAYVTLHVPLSSDEYEAIEAGGKEALDAVADRIYREICDANRGGTPERDRLKKFEEAVGSANDRMNNLECFR